MISELAAAFQGAQALQSIVSSMKGLNNYGELVSAVNAVQEKLSQALIANAQAAEDNLALLKRVGELEKEKLALEDWANTTRDYALHQVGHGTFAYVYKPPMDTGQPRHWICAKCYENRKRSILQLVHRMGYVCPGCSQQMKPLLMSGHIASIDSAYE